MKLLIADDEVQIRTGIAEGIDWSAFDIHHVYTAANGIEAWELYNLHRPDIVITDIRMPGLDGLELSRKIKEKTPSAAIILLSGYSDFQYAREAIQIGVADYELKPVKLRSLIEMVRAAQRKLAEHKREERERATIQAARCLEKLARGESGNLSGAGSNMLRYFEGAEGRFVCMAFEWDGFSVRLSASGSELRERVRGEAGRQLASWLADYEYVVTDIGERRFYVLCRLTQVHSADGWEAEARQWHWTLNSVLAELGGITLSLGMSAFGPGEALPRLVDEACHALNGKLVHGGGTVFRSLPGRAPVRHYPLPLACEQPLKDALLSRDAEAAYGLLHRQFAEAGRLPGLSREGAEKLCAELMRILQYVLPGDVKEDERQTERGEAGFGHHEILPEYEADVLGRYKEALELQRQSKGGKHTYLVKLAVDYIANHFKSDLTVETLAEVAGITPNYFSHLFNKEIGVSFREYLNRLRIEEAKRLLRNTNLLAYEITERVGFQNYKHFCHVFKKSEGCSPSDYRKHLD